MAARRRSIVAGDRPTPKRGSPKAPTRGTARGTTNPAGLRRGGVYEPDRGGQGIPRPGPRSPVPVRTPRETAEMKQKLSLPAKAGSASAKPKPRRMQPRSPTPKKKEPTYSGSKAKKARKIR